MNRPAAPRILPYRNPTEGRDYWILDDALPDPAAVRARALARTDWVDGFPHAQATWPGRRIFPGLAPDELAPIETWVRTQTGAAKLWAVPAPDGSAVHHNGIQVVGEDEGEVRPHTDSLAVCRYAAVLYLHPDVPEECGTSFFRQRLPGGRAGGNFVAPPHKTLMDALGTRFVAGDSFMEDVAVPHRCNRLLLYRANLIHSASAYWGDGEMADKRMAAVFFWMA